MAIGDAERKLKIECCTIMTHPHFELRLPEKQNWERPTQFATPKKELRLRYVGCRTTRHDSMAQSQSRYATGRTVHSLQSRSPNRDRKTGPAGATIPSR